MMTKGIQSIAVGLLASAMGLSCASTTPKNDGCPVPRENKVLGVTEECVRDVYFRGCDLRLPTPPGADDYIALFDVDEEGGVDVTYKPSAVGTPSPSLRFLVTLDHASGNPGSPRAFFVVGDSEEILIEGTTVVLFGSDVTRGASWASECVAYNLNVSGSGTTRDELDAALVRAVTESLK